jgi:ABC-2 type transport system ATP-binding protein
MADVVLKNVSKHFDDFVAVNDLSFEVRPGSIFGLLGPNGAGKTTTMRMIANILAPDSGQLYVLGKPPSIELKREIGYLPEERGLYRQMTVQKQLLFFAKIRGVEQQQARRAVEKWLERLELRQWSRHKAADLSKGMQQKVQFIATVIHDPQVLVLDEPFTGLDPVSASSLKDAILELKAHNRTIVFSTHQMQQVEEVCDEICIINHATKVLGGSLREARQHYGHRVLELEYEGPDGFVEDLKGVVASSTNLLRIQMDDGNDPHEVLNRAVAAGVRVNRFQVVEPSLNEIFIDVVRGRNEGNN